MNMLEDHEENMIKCFNEGCKTKELNEMVKKFQDRKVEFKREIKITKENPH